MRTNRGSLVTRVLRRLHGEQDGFTLLESTMAMGVMLTALLALVYVSLLGFTDIAYARQRQAGAQIANMVLEQVRGLPYATVAQGLSSTDLTGDPNIVTCSGVAYLKVCPPDASAEKIVSTTGLATTAPLVPHTATLGAPTYPNTYTRRVYVTTAVGVPVSGAYRATVVVSWSGAARGGVSGSVQAQTLIYQPTGSSDPAVNPNGSNAAFFYGTASAAKGEVTVTPGAGASGGTGVTGFGSWTSMTEELYSLDANIQQQQITKSDAQITATAARSAGGTPALSGGVNAVASADTDSTTATGTSDAPSAITQTDVSSSVSGGGNSLTVTAASGTPAVCPPSQPTGIQYMTGWELGRSTSWMGSQSAFFTSASGTVTLDSTVARTGTYSWKVAPVNSAANGYYNQTGTGVVVGHFAVRLATLPATDQVEIAAVAAAGSTTDYFSLGYQASSQKFMVRIKSGTTNGTAVVANMSPVVAGQWYTIDLLLDASTTALKGDWQVDGVAQTRATLTGTIATSLAYWYLGTTIPTATFTAYFDDFIGSTTTADYPLPDGGIKVLVPDGNSTDNLGGAITNETGTITDRSTWWQKLDEIAPTSTDYVKENSATTTAYAGFTFQDPPTAETCIKAVQGVMFSTGAGANKSNNGQFHLMDGAVDNTVWNYNLGANAPAGTVIGMGAMVPPTGGAWTNAEVAGLVGRIGYSNSIQGSVPRWDGIYLQYLAGKLTGGLGPAGTETGSAVAATAASASPACGSPAQTDGRACAYAREDYSTTGPPYLETALDLTGSGGGKCMLYKRTPSTMANATSTAYARRTAGSGGDGTLKESVNRWRGTNDFAGMCSGAGAPPANWPGYLVRFEGGVTSSCAVAEAGVGSAAPMVCGPGTIWYWNGTSVSTMSQPLAGGVIPAAAVDWTSAGWRYQITPTLSCAPSYTYQVPSGAGSGVANRTEARAVLGSAVVGSIAYRITNPSGAVVVDLTITIDLGTLTSYARYVAAT